MIGGILVRAPRPDDATEMGRIHVVAWQVGYRGFMPDEVLNALDPEQRAQTWHDALTRPTDDPPSTSIPIVAEVDGRVVGIAAYGPYRPDETETVEPGREWSELWMLNVDPDYWGGGVAQQLNAHALQELGRFFPTTTAALWVLEDNFRGRRFYEKEGWVPDGASQELDLAGFALTELRYTIAL